MKNKKMTVETAQKLIRDEALLKIICGGDFSLEDGDILEDLFGDGAPPPKSHVVSVAERYGGEGKGSVYYVILKINHPDHPVGYYRVDGHYTSWDGVEWYGDVSMVKPVTRETRMWANKWTHFESSYHEKKSIGERTITLVDSYAQYGRLIHIIRLTADGMDRYYQISGEQPYSGETYNDDYMGMDDIDRVDDQVTEMIHWDKNE